mmetsp:Transcript_2595/g.7134  ORF Transcript_2595/g.7134 Transcript_2595/m.7134 type:complete len:164 (+) Transcript_2595:2575-3066(+)
MHFEYCVEAIHIVRRCYRECPVLPPSAFRSTRPSRLPVLARHKISPLLGHLPQGFHSILELRPVSCSNREGEEVRQGKARCQFLGERMPKPVRQTQQIATYIAPSSSSTLVCSTRACFPTTLSFTPAFASAAQYKSSCSSSDHLSQMVTTFLSLADARASSSA